MIWAACRVYATAPGQGPLESCYSLTLRSDRAIEPFRLFATAIRLLGYRPDAEDAVQETCLAAMRQWVEAALDGSEIDDRAGVTEVLESVLFANMVGLVTGGRSPDDVGPALERAVQAVLGA